MRPVPASELPYAIDEEPSVRIPLPDGIELTARLWRPRTATPVPLIVEYLPYRRRDGTAARDAVNHPYFAGHGFAALRVDMRGSGDSPGFMDDEYTEQEQRDCEDVFRWAMAQPWCSGAIGMIGISWGGFNGLQLAWRQPECLKAVVSIASTVDRYADDIHFKGGALLTANFAWSAQMLSYQSRPPDPDVVGAGWKALWRSRLEHQPHLAETWLAHLQRDSYWAHGSVCEDFSRINAAVLSVGGLADGYMNAVPALTGNLRSPCRGLLGPWVHLYPHIAVPGPQVGFMQECVRWFDRFLNGSDNDAESVPALRAFRREFDPPSPSALERSGTWISEPEWPSPNVAERAFPLAEAVAATVLGTRSAAANRAFNSPQDAGAAAGEYFAWQGPDQPDDQRLDDDGSATFDFDVGDDPLDMLGRPQVRLRVRVDAPQATLAARICEVAADGTSLRVSYGVLNLSQRHGSNAAPALMPVDEPVDVVIELDTTCHRFTPGNRIRVAVSTAYWPLIWPSPTAVTADIDAGTSALVLPVRKEAAQPIPTFEEPEGAPPLALRELRPRALQRINSKDAETGETVLRVDYDYGQYEDPDHGLIAGSHQRETYHIHPDDPLSARMLCKWTQTHERGDWSTRTETSASLRCDTDFFYLSASIEAYAGDELLVERRFDKKLPRTFV